MFIINCTSGEKDAVDMSMHYNCTLVEMVKEWRNEMYVRTKAASNPQFPVGIVQVSSRPSAIADLSSCFLQLAPFKRGGSLTFAYPDIRWRQTVNYGFLPNKHLNRTFLAVAMDLPGGNETFPEWVQPLTVDLQCLIPLNPLCSAGK
jgi:sialate O-acetylesterase